MAFYALEKKVVKTAWLATWFMTLHDSNIGLCLYFKKPNNKEKRWRLRTSIGNSWETWNFIFWTWTRFRADRKLIKRDQSYQTTKNTQINRLWKIQIFYFYIVLCQRILFRYFVLCIYANPLIFYGLEIFCQSINGSFSFQYNDICW